MESRSQISWRAQSGGLAVLEKPVFTVTRLIFAMVAIQFALGLAAFVHWMATGDIRFVTFFYRNLGSFFLICFAFAEFTLSLIAWRLFSSGEPLRSAWFFIMISASFRIVGLFVANLLSGFFKGGIEEADALVHVRAVRELGLTISGPLNMTMLAVGLFVILRVYKDVGLLRKLRWSDLVLLAIVGSFLVIQICEMIRWLAALRGPVTALKGVSWITDPLLNVLLLEAILIRRAVLTLGSGLIARCWGAYTTAIFLTSLGNISLWALNWGFIPWQLTYLTSCIWFLAAPAYALGPAYQVEAITRAREPA